MTDDQPVRRCQARGCGHLVKPPAVWCPKHEYRARKIERHTDEEPGENNDLEDAVEQYRNRPRDVVPKQPYTGYYDDLAAFAGDTVPVTYYDIDDTGVHRHVENITVTRPIGEPEE